MLYICLLNRKNYTTAKFVGLTSTRFGLKQRENGFVAL